MTCFYLLNFQGIVLFLCLWMKMPLFEPPPNFKFKYFYSLWNFNNGTPLAPCDVTCSRKTYIQSLCELATLKGNNMSMKSMWFVQVLQILLQNLSMSIRQKNQWRFWIKACHHQKLTKPMLMSQSKSFKFLDSQVALG
jgi:hypothetical protein